MLKNNLEIKQEAISIIPDKSWVYIVFIRKNIFIHVYNEINGKKVAVKFYAYSTFIPKSNLKTKKDPNRVEIFADFIAEFLKGWNAKNLMLVFRGEGIRPDIRFSDPIIQIERKRRIFIAAIEANEVRISSLIDLSPIPFNGCKTARKRRGRNKARWITGN
jgi:ribosomal protein S11